MQIVDYWIRVTRWNVNRQILIELFRKQATLECCLQTLPTKSIDSCSKHFSSPRLIIIGNAELEVNRLVSGQSSFAKIRRTSDLTYADLDWRAKFYRKASLSLLFDLRSKAKNTRLGNFSNESAIKNHMMCSREARTRVCRNLSRAPATPAIRAANVIRTAKCGILLEFLFEMLARV